MNQYPNYQYTQFQNGQPYQAFSQPQPQGILYIINNPSELNNISNNSTLIAAFCFQEGTCYIKSTQNGMPIISSYKLVQQNQEEKQDSDKLYEILKDFEKRLKSLEEKSKRSGNLDELL
jgi:hypothetical protein